MTDCAALVVPRVLPEDGEGLRHVQAAALGENAFGLLENDAAGAGVLQLLVTRGRQFADPRLARLEAAYPARSEW